MSSPCNFVIDLLDVDLLRTERQPLHEIAQPDNRRLGKIHLPHTRYGSQLKPPILLEAYRTPLEGNHCLCAIHYRLQHTVQVQRRSDLVAIRNEIESASKTQPVIVWFSKGADPLPKLAQLLRSVPGVRIMADFDDDDVSIMREFRRSSVLNAAKANPLRRKAPGRLLRSQERLAALSDLVTYSSDAILVALKQVLGR